MSSRRASFPCILLFLTLLLAWGSYGQAVSEESDSGKSKEPCRDRFLWPFESSSIWNTPLGSNAVFAQLNLFNASVSPPDNFENDQDFFIRAAATDPLTPWHNQGTWNSKVDNCNVASDVAAYIPFPYNFTTASDGGRSAPGRMNNNAMGILMADNVRRDVGRGEGSGSTKSQDAERLKHEIGKKRGTGKKKR